MSNDEPMFAVAGYDVKAIPFVTDDGVASVIVLHVEVATVRADGMPSERSHMSLVFPPDGLGEVIADLAMALAAVDANAVEVKFVDADGREK